MNKNTKNKKCCDKCYGEKLLLAATAISIQLGAQCTTDELGVLAALFTIVGDQLALLEITHAECTSNGNGEPPIILDSIV